MLPTPMHILSQSNAYLRYSEESPAQADAIAGESMQPRMDCDRPGHRARRLGSSHPGRERDFFEGADAYGVAKFQVEA